MFTSLEDVETYVRQDALGNGKAMLGMQLAMGNFFGGNSRALAEAWIAKDDARIAAEHLAAREQEDRNLRMREVLAGELQAKSAREATLIAWIALGVSIGGVVIALFALFK
ncbi:hypothetical protein [Variovorax sp. S12S4]|uniref:hypothetical protein n=1 Tax=Variovorax sp. S12S4 TaxID=3029170 RepID=UPI00215BFBFE|nr:hypothetical protein [Variovorax sp. S12S4]